MAIYVNAEWLKKRRETLKRGKKHKEEIQKIRIEEYQEQLKKKRKIKNKL